MKKIPMLEKFAAQSLVEHDGELIFSKEKFAELIVQECSKIVLNCGIPGSNNERDFIVASREIKQHFGVEE